MPSRILNIASGKQKPLYLDREIPYILINVDKMYWEGIKPGECESYYSTWMKRPNENRMFNVNYDIQEFLERTTMKFDLVTIYRYLEHVPMTDVLYFIYLVSTVVEKDSIIDIIVPDYRILCEMLLYEDIDSRDYEENNIIITTEMLNEPYDPHASIWTKSRIEHYWELEKRFKIEDVEENFVFDGRSIYLRAVGRRL